MMAENMKYGILRKDGQNAGASTGRVASHTCVSCIQAAGKIHRMRTTTLPEPTHCHGRHEFVETPPPPYPPAAMCQPRDRETSPPIPTQPCVSCNDCTSIIRVPQHHMLAHSPVSSCPCSMCQGKGNQTSRGICRQETQFATLNAQH